MTTSIYNDIWSEIYFTLSHWQNRQVHANVIAEPIFYIDNLYHVLDTSNQDFSVFLRSYPSITYDVYVDV